jgi:hypothetical protein
MRYLGVLVTVAALAFDTSARAQQADRVALLSAETRRCENALLSDAQGVTALRLSGTSLGELCQCEAQLVVAAAQPSEFDGLLRGQFTPRLLEKQKLASQYCIATQWGR